MTPAESLFIIKYEELCRLIDDLKVNDLLALSGILRLFLLDKPNIVDIVNRQHRLKILFPPAGDDPNNILLMPEGLPKPIFSYSGIWGTTDKILSRDQLLARVAFVLNEKPYTYKQFILLVANKLGGVHFDEDFRKHPELADLAALNEQIGIGGAPSALWVILDIGKVVREGLVDLFTRVQE